LKTLCIEAVLPESDCFMIEENLLELKELGQTAGYDIIDSLVISIPRFFSATLMSQPLAEEIGLEIKEKEAEVVLLNVDLSSSQLKNLEKIWEVMIVDRTELILKIFQNNARTKEAKLQVEIAQLRYTLPRLKRMWGHLSRIEGGFGFTKGPGETQIEIDRRIIKDRISFLSSKVKKISQRREVRRKKRVEADLPMVSLVGYTNAGKTALLNCLAKEQKESENKLFATLSPVTRKVFLDFSKYMLLSDTVGFIKNLPSHLIASFHSTLQEIEYSDLLILLQDVTSNSIFEKVDTVHTVLDEINCLSKKTLLVFTKIDLIQDESVLNRIKSNYPDALFISSLTKEGIDTLKTKILEMVF